MSLSIIRSGVEKALLYRESKILSKMEIGTKCWKCKVYQCKDEII